MSGYIKGLTIAGLLGLAVLHPQPFAAFTRTVTGTFRKAANLA